MVWGHRAFQDRPEKGPKGSHVAILCGYNRPGEQHKATQRASSEKSQERSQKRVLETSLEWFRNEVQNEVRNEV